MKRSEARGSNRNRKEKPRRGTGIVPEESTELVAAALQLKSLPDKDLADFHRQCLRDQIIALAPIHHSYDLLVPAAAAFVLRYKYDPADIPAGIRTKVAAAILENADACTRPQDKQPLLQPTLYFDPDSLPIAQTYPAKARYKPDAKGKLSLIPAPQPRPNCGASWPCPSFKSYEDLLANPQ